MTTSAGGRDRDVVFFLGAGFARSAGLPVMAEFGEDSRRERELLIERHGVLDPTEEEFRFAAARVVDAGTTFEAFKQFCIRSGTRDEEDWENLETVFCVAEALSEAGVPEIKLRLPAPATTRGGSFHQLHSTRTVLRDIQMWIWKVYQRMPLVQRNPEVEVHKDAYERFFSAFRDCKLQPKTTILTTNYDLVYEFVSWQHDMKCVYPMQWTDGFSVSQTPEPYIVEYPAKSPATVVCKLHGSVNFFEDHLTAETQRIRVARDLGGGETVGNSGDVRGRPALLALDAIWAVEKRYGPSLTPAIVPPTYAKLGRQPWLQDMWAEAQRAISEARVLIFIGYSLPSSDGFMSALFSGAAAMREVGDLPEVVVVDPCEDSFKRISSVFGTTNVTWIEKGFAEATESELPNLMARL